MLIFSAAISAIAQKNVPAQNVSLTDIKGDSFSLSEVKGKVVVLAFGATWLPLSRQQIIVTNKLAKKYAGKDVAIYWVATDSAAAKSKNFASMAQISAYGEKNKLASPILRDPDGTFALRKYSVDQIPSFIVLDKEGKQSAEPYSGLDIDTDITPDLISQIDKLLK